MADSIDAEQAQPAPAATPVPVTYTAVGTQTEASMLELFHTYSKRKWALSLAEQYMNIHPSFREGDIILKSSDEIGFKFSLARLGECSTFFKDLADLPRPEDSSNVIPLPNASAATIEVLLSALRPFVPNGKNVLVPSVKVLDELVDVVDVFDFDMQAYHHTVFDSDLNIGIKYAFAYAYANHEKDGLAMEILDEGSLHGCSTWDRCPQARDELRRLMHQWSLVRGKFKNLFVSTDVQGKDDFGKKCEKQECPAHARFRGNWDNLKRAVAKAVSKDFPRTPVYGYMIDSTCHRVVPCDTCAKRLARHAEFVWRDLVSSGKWKE